MILPPEGGNYRRSIFATGGQSEQLLVAGVTPGLLDLVGGSPLMGRRFVPADAHEVQPVAIISYGLWQPTAPLESIQTMEDLVHGSLSRPRLYAGLLATFAAFALAIAGVGLFGVLSYTVAQRAREIGVRTALGAQMRDIIGLVVGQSMTIAGAGLAAGLGASYWLTGALQKFLYGVTAHDAVSFGAVAGVLLLVSILASIVPARRAARVDPIKVLRA